MHPDLAALLPRNKIDTDRARAVVVMVFPAVEPALPELLEWMQDVNWPVALELQPLFVGMGKPLAPYIRRILETDDDIWKANVVDYIVAKSADLKAILRPELERLAASPTPGEQ